MAAWDTLLQARPAGIMLHALINPDGPALRHSAEFDAIHPNAYAAGRPDCLVRLSDDDPLFIARLIQTVPSVALASALPSDPLERELVAYWLRRSDAVVDPADLWATVAQIARPTQPGDQCAVFTHNPATPLAQALQRRGARIFGAELVALLSPRFEQTLLIIDGQPNNTNLLHLLRRYGGDVILTGTCLLGAYGAQAAAIAETELGRPIPATELAQWRQGIARPAALFLGEVASAARTLFVPSAWLAREVTIRHGRHATVVPIAGDPSIAGPPGTITAIAAGLHAEACVWALELLRFWSIDAHLTLDCPPPEHPALTQLATRLQVGDRLRFGTGPAAVTATLAMRGDARPVGRLVAALAAGPCIASLCLAEAIDPPPWLDIIPDQPSPPLLASAFRTALAQPPPETAPWPAHHAPDAIAAALG